MIVGLWHGTGWNYLVYGLYQAFFVSTAILLAPVYKVFNMKLNISNNSFWGKLYRIIRTFLVLTVGRYFIRANNLQQAFELYKKTLGVWRLSQVNIFFDKTIFQLGLDERNIYLMYLVIVLLIVVDILHEQRLHLRELIMRQHIIIRYGLYMLAIFGIIILGIYGEGFDKSTFIYAGF